MENNNQRALCQKLWAENKYLVLSHSSNIYKDIRQYLKQEVVELSQVQEMIDRACQIPEHRGQASKQDLITRTRDLLKRYPNSYLQNSTLLKGDSHETLA